MAGVKSGVTFTPAEAGGVVGSSLVSCFVGMDEDERAKEAATTWSTAWHTV